MTKFEARIQLPNASPTWVYIWAPNNQTARAMLVAQVRCGGADATIEVEARRIVPFMVFVADRGAAS